MAVLVAAASLAAAACGGGTPSAPSGVATGAASPATAEAASGPSAADVSAAPSSPSSAPSPSAPVYPVTPLPTIRVSPDVVRLPYPVSRAVAFVDGGTIVVAGGLSPSGTTASVLRLDPSTGTVTRIGALADPVHDAAGGVVGGTDLVLGGGRTTQDATVQDVTMAGASAVVGRLPAPRADLSAVTVNGELVVAGGAGSGLPDRRVLATTDGRAFRVMATLPVGVRYAAAATLDGLVWLFGGSDGTHDLATIQVIDPVAGTARVAGRLPAPLSHAAAFVLGGRVYLAGGRRDGRAQDAILAFDPATASFTPAGRVPRPLSDSAVAVVGSSAWLIGGEATSPVASVVRLTPR